MIRKRMLFCLAITWIATGVLPAAQVPPAPPVRPATPQAPQPPQAPQVPVAPLPPNPPDPFDFDFDFNFDFDGHTSDYFNSPDWNAKMADLNAKMAGLNANLQNRLGSVFQARGALRSNNDDQLYERGQNAMDRGQWENALTNFTQVASHGGARTDGALYWKAYTLNKLGRRDEALAAIADLKKAYASSRWLADANALEIEVKQASGQNVSPEAQADEELKLMALNALVSSDPDRAVPLIENLLKSGQSLRVKERALFVLAQSNSDRARQLLEQIAKGGGNPDLQLKAIRYLGTTGKKSGNNQTLFDIYNGATDDNVKRAALQGLMVAGDNDHILQIAKTDKSSQLRVEAVRMLAGRSETGDALTSLYATDQDAQVRRAIIDSLFAQRNAKALVDLARKESDAEIKRTIVQRLSTMKGSKEATDYFMELLK